MGRLHRHQTVSELSDQHDVAAAAGRVLAHSSQFLCGRGLIYIKGTVQHYSEVIEYFLKHVFSVYFQ